MLYAGWAWPRRMQSVYFTLYAYDIVVGHGLACTALLNLIWFDLVY
jgi:hypothetical protein